ncbi:hypothetical protein A1O3_04832 [Capronia epimyces CBS 606.96]|uniref:Alpha-1,3-mannosyltransferase n=1 Tax=Capronia epimyces CBS 606.96 TaxID=1182542 RepID=W9Y3E3_9EURO|nr:uncharacterized protein A1O3_04832 [Capronia epimyces CBS 606.96]EXJ84165.1 hypothetical protein A1O3_04832 [Capronia epimyces CBS 606.96]
MPPHLHPRSTATSTLFAGTLLASFIVVGIPHIFPCPRPRTGYADAEIQIDEDGRPIRRKLRQSPRETSSSISARDQESTGLAEVLTRNAATRRRGLAQSKDLEEEAALFRDLQREAEALEMEARECPVPKPKGVIGRLLGFEDKRLVPEADGKS